MSKKCGNCGDIAADDVSVFCNTCGARLPVKDILTCGTCGKIFSGAESQFCNRCGSQLASAVRVATPAIPETKGKNCPACGFENFGENRFYCKKCGAYLLKSDPIRKNEPAEKTEIKKSSINIKPDSPNIGRLKDLYRASEGHKMPLSMMDEQPQKTRSVSYRKFAAIGAGIILIVIITGIFAFFTPGVLPAGPVTSTVPNLTSSVAQGAAEANTATLGSPAIKIKPQTPVAGLSAMSKTIDTISPEIGSTQAVTEALQGKIDPTAPWPMQVEFNATNPWPMVVEYNATNPWPMVVEYNATNPWPMVAEYNATNPWPL